MQRMSLVLSFFLFWMVGAAADPEDFRSLLDFSDPAGTEAKLQELLPVVRESGNTGYLAEILTQIARTHSRRGNFDEAHRILDDVEPMLSDDYPLAKIRYWLERGRTFHLAQNKKDEALSLFHKAFDLAGEIGDDYLAVDAAHMIAVAVSDFESQMVWLQKALAIAEKGTEPDTRRWIGSLTTNLGWTYFDHEEYESALKYFEQALAYRESRGDLEPILQAKWNIGRSYRALGRFDEAMKLQKWLLAEYKKNELPVYGYVYEEMAELLYRVEDPDARTYFRLAYEALSQDVWMVNSEPDRLERLKKLGLPESEESR